MQEGIRPGQQLLAISDPIRNSENWTISIETKLSRVRDALQFRSPPTISLQLTHSSIEDETDFQWGCAAYIAAMQEVHAGHVHDALHLFAESVRMMNVPHASCCVCRPESASDTADKSSNGQDLLSNITGMGGPLNTITAPALPLFKMMSLNELYSLQHRKSQPLFSNRLLEVYTFQN